MSLKRRHDEYDSAFEGDSFVPRRGQAKGRGDPILHNYAATSHTSYPSRESLNDLSCMSIGQTLRYHQSSLTAYDRHKMLVNQYLLYHPGASLLLRRDSSRDRRDMDVVRAHHRFLWEDETAGATAAAAAGRSWEEQLAKKYYDKLFREYCICDLSHYTIRKVGLRWRVQEEVVSGKGQFVCSEKHCDGADGLRSWETNFAYVENHTKKNALVKLRLCEACSVKLNFCHKRKDITKKLKKRRPNKTDDGASTSCKRRSDGDEKGEEDDHSDEYNKDKEQHKDEEEETVSGSSKDVEDIWKAPAKLLDEKSREQEFEDYLEDLLL